VPHVAGACELAELVPEWMLLINMINTSPQIRVLRIYHRCTLQ